MPETVRLSHPVDYLAITPYLLGFHPAMSLVILSFHDRALVGSARHDLPGDPHETGDVVATCMKILTRSQADGAAVIGYGPAEQVMPLLESLRGALASAGIAVLQLLRCADNRYWTHLDAGPTDGTPFDLTASAAAAQAVVAGLSALPDRGTFAACLEPADGPDREAIRQATQAARERAETLLTTEQPRYWYDEGTRALHEAFARTSADQPLSPEERAWLGVLLTSIVVRDIAMTLLGCYPPEAHIKLWGEVTRGAEPGYVAAPAALLAFAAYSRGAGTLARIAVDRALADNPRYSLAHLLDFSLREAMPPSMIHEMRVADMGERIAAQVESCPRAALPRLPVPAKGR
ncbi:DUF4192 domain-containing protein [Nonomuraea sp. NPDC049709]|uniref:DUF4192 domain-containing protein n=1 Tax=Nonomuraea sp. NPDC049709 TaxID=3154736 RepID=UPI003446AD80